MGVVINANVAIFSGSAPGCANQSNGTVSKYCFVLNCRGMKLAGRGGYLPRFSYSRGVVIK